MTENGATQSDRSWPLTDRLLSGGSGQKQMGWMAPAPGI